MMRETHAVRLVTEAGEWDALVQAFPGHDVKQCFAWGELRGERGWRPWRLAVLRGDRPVAAASVLVRRVRGLGALLYVPHGPLFREDDPPALGHLVEAVRVRARTVGGVVVRLSPAVGHDDRAALALLAGAGFRALPDTWTTWNAPRYVQVLDLRPSEEELRRGVRRRFREHIASAARKGLTVEEAGGEAELAGFHALVVNAARAKGFPVRDLAYFRSLVERFRPSGGKLLLLARAHGQLAGGLLALRFGRVAHVLHSSVRSGAADALRHAVAPALFWEFMRRARAAGCESIDLGGTGVTEEPRETDPGYGVYHFKAGLGAVLRVWAPYQDLILRPLAYRLFRASEARLLPEAWKLAARLTTVAPWRLSRARA